MKYFIQILKKNDSFNILKLKGLSMKSECNFEMHLKTK